MLEHGQTQVEQDVPHRRQHLRTLRLEPQQPLAQRLRELGRARQVLELEAERREVLRHRVVKLPGDPPPLLLLCAQDPVQVALLLGTRRALLRHLGARLEQPLAPQLQALGEGADLVAPELPDGQGLIVALRATHGASQALHGAHHRVHREPRKQ